MNTFSFFKWLPIKRKLRNLAKNWVYNSARTWKWDWSIQFYIAFGHCKMLYIVFFFSKSMDRHSTHLSKTIHRVFEFCASSMVIFLASNPAASLTSNFTCIWKSLTLIYWIKPMKILHYGRLTSFFLHCRYIGWRLLWYCSLFFSISSSSSLGFTSLPDNSNLSPEKRHRNPRIEATMYRSISHNPIGILVEIQRLLESMKVLDNQDV